MAIRCGFCNRGRNPCHVSERTIDLLLLFNIDSIDQNTVIMATY